MASTTGYFVPQDRYYDGDSHMWAKIDSDERIVVGIDELGLASLGDLAYLSLLPTGLPVQRGESVGTIEAAKMTGDIVAPIAGLLIDRNAQAVGDPSVVNRDPYGEGWLVAIQPRAWEKDAAELVSGEAIPDWVNSEIARYRAEGWID